jgi:hypothetical protein
MDGILRMSLCAALLLSAVGCQACHPLFKRACDDACGPEIHVKAPPQKVVVHRDDCKPEAPCEEEKCAPEVKAPPKQQPEAGQPRVGAPAGYAAVPVLPTSTAFTLTFDVIKIPIPIPRIRTIDVPPETKLSFIQAPAVGAMVAPVAAAPTAGAAECIRPEELAAAVALLRAQNNAAQSAGAAPATASTAAPDPRLKLVEELEKRCDELEKAKAARERGDGWKNGHK